MRAVSTMLFVVALVGAAAARTSLPGLEVLVSSVAGADFDVLQSYKGALGFPPFNVSYNNPEHTVSIGGATYAYPDQLWITTTPAGICGANTIFTSSGFNFSEQLAVNFATDIDPLFGLLGSASASSSAGQAFAFQSQGSVAVGAAFCSVAIYQFSVLPEALLQPDVEFAQGVTALLSPNPEFASSVANWNSFYQSWRPYYFARGEMGGSIGAVWGYNLADFHANGAAYAAMQAELSLLWSVSAAGGATASANGATAAFLTAAQNRTYWHGGSFTGSYDPWLASLVTQPALGAGAELRTTLPLILKVDPLLERGAIDAMNNITAVRMLTKVVIPQLKAAKALVAQSNVNLSVAVAQAQAACAAHAASCSVGYWPSPSCCPATYHIINTSAIEEKRAAAVRQLDATIAAIELAATARIISQLAYFALLADALALYATTYLAGMNTLTVCTNSASSATTCPPTWTYHEGGNHGWGQESSCGCGSTGYPGCGSCVQCGIINKKNCWDFNGELCCGLPCRDVPQFDATVAVPTVILP